MPIPDVSLAIKDYGLGILADNPEGVHVKVGVCSAGTANEIVSASDLDGLSALGEGPLVEAAAAALATTVNGRGPRPVYCVRADTTGGTAAAASAVTPTRVGTSTGTVATTGSTPFDTYDVIVEITRTGTTGTGAFKVSLDGGDTYNPEAAIPGGGSYTVPSTGVVLVFTPGAGPTFFEKGDLFKFTTTAAYYTTAKLAEAVTALLNDARTWAFVHFVGTPADHTALASLFDAVATHVATFETNGRYVFAVLEAPDATDSNLISAMSAKANGRIMVPAGFEERYSPRNGRYLKRPAAWTLAARLASIPIHEEPGRLASGPIAGVSKLYRDERKTAGLDAERFATLRTHLGVQGFHVTAGRMFAANGSDFGYVTNRRVMDRACDVGRLALLRFLNESVRVNSNGTIDERDARFVEAYVEGQLNAALVAPGSASSLTVQVNRTDNILSTAKLRATIRVVPLGYFRQISAELSLLNPALLPATT